MSTGRSNLALPSSSPAWGRHVFLVRPASTGLARTVDRMRTTIRGAGASAAQGSVASQIEEELPRPAFLATVYPPTLSPGETGSASVWKVILAGPWHR